MGVIFTISSFSTLPGVSDYWVDIILKKLAHMLEFGLLYIYLYRAIRWHQALHPRQLLLAFSIAILYAATDEIHQSFIPGRHPEIFDVLIDTYGIFVAQLVIHQDRSTPLLPSHTKSPPNL
jgi:VanZ family protein